MAKILIVDDQTSVIMTLESILADAGHLVVSATNSTDAIDRLQSKDVDLIITDAVMPGSKSGFELIRTIRASAHFSKIPIIMLTGKREKEDVERGVEAGANDYIIKPIDPEILLAKTAGLLVNSTSAQKVLQEVNVRIACSVQDETEIIALTEIGMTLISNVSIAVGTKIKLQTELFKEIGINPPILRVVAASPSEKNPQKHIIKVQFIGMSEKEFRPVRLYIASKQRTSAA